MCERCGELYADVSAARNVARIAKQALGDERNRHSNEIRRLQRKEKQYEEQIAKLQKQVDEIKHDATIMFATLDSQEEQIRIKDGQIAFMKCLVDCIAEDVERAGINTTYEELVQRVYARRKEMKAAGSF